MKDPEFIIVAVKDELSGTFLQPTFVQSREIGLRTFKTQINTIPIWKENASDFSFYQIGYFNEETGVITGEIEKITSGHSVKED